MLSTVLAAATFPRSHQLLARLLQRKGAAATAGAIAFAAQLDYRAIVVWTRSRAREALLAKRRRPEPALASRARLHHRERAQALIEFAFIAPLIFVFLFAIVDFSIAIDRRLVLQHAVREGARFGAVHSVCDAPTPTPSIAQTTLHEAQDISGVTVHVSYIDKNSNGNAGNVGDAVKVEADFTWNFPILREMFTVFGVTPPSLDMTPSGTARLEQTVSPTTGCTATS